MDIQNVRTMLERVTHIGDVTGMCESPGSDSTTISSFGLVVKLLVSFIEQGTQPYLGMNRALFL